MRVLTVRCFVILTLSLAPVFASAQTSNISGTVRDASGGVLPGVTIEASSPALIEKTRSTVSSGSGTYSIVALRPGIYTVKFELPGFTTVVREGVELTSDFTATINVDVQGQQAPVTYKGTVEKNTMKGTLDIGGMLNGTFTATKK